MSDSTTPDPNAPTGSSPKPEAAEHPTAESASERTVELEMTGTSHVSGAGRSEEAAGESGDSGADGSVGAGPVSSVAPQQGGVEEKVAVPPVGEGAGTAKAVGGETASGKAGAGQDAGAGAGRAHAGGGGGAAEEDNAGAGAAAEGETSRAGAASEKTAAGAGAAGEGELAGSEASDGGKAAAGAGVAGEGGDAGGNTADGEKAVGVGAAAGGGKADGANADGAKAGADKAGGEKAAGEVGKKKWYRRVKVRRNPWLTVGGVVVALLVLAVVGYVWGLGPLNRLNTARGITPPAKLAGLDRITDEEIRGRLQLDQTREALSRINDGKQATVEAYGALDGTRIFVVIALRGKVDVDKTIADSGATPDQVKEVGRSTCVESSGNLPTQCYRSSSTLTVIAQVANEGVGVDAVGPVADEAFNAMK